MSAETVRTRDGRNLDVDDVVAQLVDAGPDDARTIITRKQAQALVHRDLLDHGRQDTADAIDKSVWTVDDRLAEARHNVDAVAAVARVLLALDLLDPETDLGLDEQTDEDTDEPEPAFVAETLEELRDEVGEDATLLIPEEGDDAASAEEPALDDATPTPWASIMALDAVTEVTRSRDGDAVTVQVDDATDDDRDQIRAALHDLGLGIYSTEEFGDSGRANLRARAPSDDADEQADESAEDGAHDEADTEDVEQDAPDEDAAHDAESADEDDGPTDAEVAAARGREDAHTCHYCGEAFTVDEDADADLLVEWNDDPEHPACASCLYDVATGDELEPLPEFRDRADDPEDEPVDEAAEDDEQDDDETEGYECKAEGCDFVADTPGGLGGHRRYCEYRNAE